MKKIVVLDGFTLNPLPLGESSALHPSWQALADLGDLQVFDRTAASAVSGVAKDAEILLTNKTPITAETIAALPKLEYIGVIATGTNVVDLNAAKERGIPVTNVPGYAATSAVQMVFSLLFELTGRIGETAQAVRNGDWARCPDFSFTIAPFFEVSGKTLGIVGYGAIGEAVAAVGSALGMNVIVHSRTEKDSKTPISWVTLEELLETADVITLHCPLTPQTAKLINADTINKLKSGVWLINTGRGGLVDEAAVAEGLSQGKPAGYGADVLSSEPPSHDNPLLLAPNTVITPHIAWASVEARRRLMDGVVENLAAHLSGSPQNVVNF